MEMPGLPQNKLHAASYKRTVLSKYPKAACHALDLNELRNKGLPPYAIYSGVPSVTGGLLARGTSPQSAWRNAALQLTACGQNEGTIGVTVRVPTSLHAAVCKAAAQSGAGITGWVLSAIEKGLL